MSDIAVKITDITKSFGSVVANDSVNLEIKNGRVHSLLGENGAGKSTLMNMLSGVYSPDSGTIEIDGKIRNLKSPKSAIDLGVGMIYQHFKLVEVLTAKENIVLGDKPGLKKDEVSKNIKELCDKYSLDIDLNKKVYNMSVGEKQTLEIVKVLYRGARILILDEPTAVLTPQEIDKLFSIIRNMKNQGCAIVIITHKLNEVMEISDDITVLRKGRSIKTLENKNVEVSALIDMMVGKKVELNIERADFENKEEILSLENVTVLDEESKIALDDITFDLMTGEILGVAGVAKSGQKELCEVIAGLIPSVRGKINFEGVNIVGKSPRTIIQMGIRMGFIPEDRLGMGLIGGMDLVDNVLLKDYQELKGPFLRRKSFVEKTSRIVSELEIATPSIHTQVKKLSGGNIQKVLLGRELDSAPKVLITAYPVRGLDISASYKIYSLLNEEKKKGTGVLFIGEDLDVLMSLCDRILVLYNGKITGIVDPRVETKEDIGMLMTGEFLDD